MITCLYLSPSLSLSEFKVHIDGYHDFVLGAYDGFKISIESDIDVLRMYSFTIRMFFLTSKFYWLEGKQCCEG